mmetsp:Transcript_2554/g.5478  ORF Transcript_2554/g.5478 Transcript_2554/m.5478 type:complete len:234 (+) Transcript_2554:35-736(+)
MPSLDYSKFDQIVDSDEEQPKQPAVTQASPSRAEAKEDAAAKVASLDAEGSDEKVHCDRFAYAEEDVSKVVKESLKKHVAAVGGLRLAEGFLSVASVGTIDGEAMRVQVHGSRRFHWDFTFDIHFAFKWASSNFDVGMQRAEGKITVSDFTDATTLTSAKTPANRKARWLELGGLDKAQRKTVEDSLGHREWPPPPQSLLSLVCPSLVSWSQSMAEVVQAARQAEHDSGAAWP